MRGMSEHTIERIARLNKELAFVRETQKRVKVAMPMMQEILKAIAGNDGRIESDLRPIYDHLNRDVGDLRTSLSTAIPS